MNSQNKGDKFLVMWDMYGLECLINISDAERKTLVEVLAGEKLSWRNPIQHMLLRAHANMQRCYEIYLFESTVDEVFLREVFSDDPQLIVELIREKGTQIYSGRNTRKALIT